MTLHDEIVVPGGRDQLARDCPVMGRSLGCEIRRGLKQKPEPGPDPSAADASSPAAQPTLRAGAASDTSWPLDPAPGRASPPYSFDSRAAAPDRAQRVGRDFRESRKPHLTENRWIGEKHFLCGVVSPLRIFEHHEYAKGKLCEVRRAGAGSNCKTAAAIEVAVADCTIQERLPWFGGPIEFRKKEVLKGSPSLFCSCCGRMKPSGFTVTESPAGLNALNWHSSGQVVKCAIAKSAFCRRELKRRTHVLHVELVTQR